MDEIKHADQRCQYVGEVVESQKSRQDQQQWRYLDRKPDEVGRIARERFQKKLTQPGEREQ